MSVGRKRYALNVIGPFYVEDQCCTAEIDKMVEVMHTQDLDCVRNGGDDPAMLRLLDAKNLARLCDRPSARITR